MADSVYKENTPHRPGRTLRGWMLRLGTATFLGGLLIWVFSANVRWERTIPRPNRLPERTPNAAASPLVETAQSTEAVGRDVATRPLALLSALESIEPSVVRIEVDGTSGLEVIGSGFVVDATGLVATNWHVATQMTQGVARFRNGAVYEVAGYAAFNEKSDLAILRLRTGSNLPAVRLAAGDPQPLAAVFAVGHPQGVEFSPFDGKVSRMVTTSELSAATKKFVRELTGSDRDHRWIQHTANLTDGNSGGPLVDERGAVIGLNTWVDRQTGFGYALPSSEIISLLAGPLAESEPLEAHATSEARLRARLWQASAEELRQLLEEARAMRWQPTSRRDYSRLQHLAFGITLANQPQLFGGQSTVGERFEDLVRAADQAVALLRKEQWNSAGQILLLNEFAATEVHRPLAGLIFVGTIERIVSGPDKDEAAIVVLAGFEKRLLVPLESGLHIPGRGAQCLIVGVNDRGRTVQYGDNPLDPIVAPVVVAPVVIELGK